MEQILSYLEDPLVQFIVVMWTLSWKGYALWKSARLMHKKWFIVILVFQTLALLEVLYIFIFSDKEKVLKLKRFFRFKEKSTTSYE